MPAQAKKVAASKLKPTQKIIQFPEGPKLHNGTFVRRDEAQGVHFILDYLYWFEEIWVPSSQDGFEFRELVDGSWEAQEKAK